MDACNWEFPQEVRSLHNCDQLCIKYLQHCRSPNLPGPYQQNNPNNKLEAQLPQPINLSSAFRNPNPTNPSHLPPTCPLAHLRRTPPCHCRPWPPARSQVEINK
ncbi:hypothetical protein V6Z11_A12G270700 [Gossypium hirsutum]